MHKILTLTTVVFLIPACRSGQESTNELQSINSGKRDIAGQVSLEDTNSGSKVFITTYEGKYQLRGPRENSFTLPLSKKLVGKYVVCHGDFANQFLFAYSSCEETRPREIITGDVSLQETSPGSHSEATRVVITTTDHKVYWLRQVNENPFETPVSRTLVGKHVSCEGNFVGGSVFAYFECKAHEAKN